MSSLLSRPEEPARRSAVQRTSAERTKQKDQCGEAQVIINGNEERKKEKSTFKGCVS